MAIGRLRKAILIGSVATLGIFSAAAAQDSAMVPGQAFDLSHWKITLPLDNNNDGKPDEKSVSQIANYENSDFFYLNEEGGLVFALLLIRL